MSVMTVADMQVITDGRSACDHILEMPGTLEGGRCKKVKHRGDAVVYAVTVKGSKAARYVLAIGDALSPPIDISEDCAAHKCSEVEKVTVKLDATTVEGEPAFAIDLDAKMSYGIYDPDTTKVLSKTTFHRRVILACDDQHCATIDVGEPEASCTATLDPGGSVTYRCPTEEVLSFGQ